MSSDSARDHELFNCSENHEREYVASQYNENQQVKNFLKEKCASGKINNIAHDKLYALIEKELGLSRK